MFFTLFLRFFCIQDPGFQVECEKENAGYVTNSQHLLKDKFGFEMLRTGKYTTRQIGKQWPDETKQEFLKWLDGHPQSGKTTRNILNNKSCLL